MVTKRRSKGARRTTPITAAALDAFAKLVELEQECTCAPRDWGGKYWEHKICEACERWWDQHAILHRELKARVWDWPCIEHPDAASPYPEGCFADQHWKPDVAGQKRYKMLQAALEEREKAAS